MNIATTTTRKVKKAVYSMSKPAKMDGWMAYKVRWVGRAKRKQQKKIMTRQACVPREFERRTCRLISV